MNLISHLEPQWDDEDVKQIASTLTPEQTAAVYAEARQLLGIDEPPAPEPMSEVDAFSCICAFCRNRRNSGS